MLLPILIFMLSLQVAQQVFDLVLTLHRSKALFQFGLAHPSSVQMCACFCDEKCLLCPPSGRGLIDAAADAGYSARDIG